MPNDPTFDLTKRYVHMQDNDDGTLTITLNKVGVPEENSPTTVVVFGAMDEVISTSMRNMTIEDIEEFNNRTLVIPNEMEAE